MKIMALNFILIFSFTMSFNFSIAIVFFDLCVNPGSFKLHNTNVFDLITINLISISFGLHIQERAQHRTS